MSRRKSEVDDLVAILTALWLLTRETKPAATCGVCGCLLYPSDHNCPKCRYDLMGPDDV